MLTIFKLNSAWLARAFLARRTMSKDLMADVGRTADVLAQDSKVNQRTYANDMGRTAEVLARDRGEADAYGVPVAPNEAKPSSSPFVGSASGGVPQPDESESSIHVPKGFDPYMMNGAVPNHSSLENIGKDGQWRQICSVM